MNIPSFSNVTLKGNLPLLMKVVVVACLLPGRTVTAPFAAGVASAAFFQTRIWSWQPFHRLASSSLTPKWIISWLGDWKNASWGEIANPILENSEGISLGEFIFSPVSSLAPTPFMIGNVCVFGGLKLSLLIKAVQERNWASGIALAALLHNRYWAMLRGPAQENPSPIQNDSALVTPAKRLTQLLFLIASVAIVWQHRRSWWIWTSFIIPLINTLSSAAEMDPQKRRDWQHRASGMPDRRPVRIATSFAWTVIDITAVFVAPSYLTISRVAQRATEIAASELAQLLFADCDTPPNESDDFP